MLGAAGGLCRGRGVWAPVLACWWSLVIPVPLRVAGVPGATSAHSPFLDGGRRSYERVDEMGFCLHSGAQP